MKDKAKESGQQEQPGVPGCAPSPARGDADQALPAVSPRPQAAELCRAIEHYNREREDAASIAERVLDEPGADPDDDLRVLARQFQRAREREFMARDLLRAAAPRPQAAEAETRPSVLDAAERDGKFKWNPVMRAAEEELRRRGHEFAEVPVIRKIKPVTPAAESGDVFEQVAREMERELREEGHSEYSFVKDATKILRERFGGLHSYVKVMAARPCVTPNHDCGWCDSCEARASLRGPGRDAAMSGDVFEQVAREWYPIEFDGELPRKQLAALLRERLGPLVEALETFDDEHERIMHGKGCSCRYCQAHEALRQLRARAEAGGTPA